MFTLISRVTLYPVLRSLRVSAPSLTNQTLCGLPRLRGGYLPACAQARALVDALVLLQHLAMPAPTFVGSQLSPKVSPMFGKS